MKNTDNDATWGSSTKYDHSYDKHTWMSGVKGNLQPKTYDVRRWCDVMQEPSQSTLHWPMLSQLCQASERNNPKILAGSY